MGGREGGREMKKEKRRCDIPNCFKIASYGSIFCIDHTRAEKKCLSKPIKPFTNWPK